MTCSAAVLAETVIFRHLPSVSVQSDQTMPPAFGSLPQDRVDPDTVPDRGVAFRALGFARK